MIVITCLSWLLSLLFAAALLSMLMLRKRLAAFMMLIAIMLVLPVTATVMRQLLDFRFLWLMKGVAVLLLVTTALRLMISGSTSSIYKDTATEQAFRTMYAEQMREWPVPYEDSFISTGYGTVHIIQCGDKELPDMLLLHASGVSGWSWKFNAAELSSHFRLTVIDTIGDAGLSSYSDLHHTLRSGREQAELYCSLMDIMKIDSALVVGASEGGFIGTNLALYHPERVSGLVLAGPMGYSGAGRSIRRITLAQLFPFRGLQKRTIRWAFGESEVLMHHFEQWFRLLLSSVFPKKVAPLPFTKLEMESLKIPALFIFGNHDNLVGNPETASNLVGVIPDVRVEILDAGHLMAAEKPADADRLILDFSYSILQPEANS